MRRIKALLLTLITLGALAWAPPTASADVDVYVTPGTHNVNGRQWRTTCEKYSATDRCRTEIWATVIVKKDGGGYAVTNGWQFNNLTYAASDYTLWIENPLATPSEKLDAGREAVAHRMLHVADRTRLPLLDQGDRHRDVHQRRG